MKNLNNDNINEIINLISKDNLMQHTKEISKWERLSGSKAEAEAFKYIKNVLNDLELETKEYYADTYISIPIEGEISYSGINIKAYPPAMSGNTPTEGIIANAEYIDMQSVNPNDISHLEDTIAIIDGMPMPGLLSLLKKSQCAGAIFVQSADLVSESIVSPVWGSPSVENMSMMPSIPIVSINHTDGQNLKSYVSKNPNQAVNLITKVDTGWRKIPVLTAEIKSPCNTGDYILFSGHVDSWHFGAMDNGTANATMLEVAKLMVINRENMKRNLRLAFWSGHSHGRYAGSAWYADEFWQDIHDNCVLHVNIDSVGAMNSTILTEAHVMKETKEMASKYVKEYANQELSGNRTGRAGDQSFWGHGVPSLFLTLSEQPPNSSKSTDFAKIVGGSSKTSGLGWWWHTSADTFDKIDSNYLLRDAKIYGACIIRYCCDDIIPLDLRPAIDEIKNQLYYWQNEAGEYFNLKQVIEKITILGEKINKIYDNVNIETISDESVTAFNNTIKGLEKILVPINYVSGDIFHHDLAVNQPPVPSLSLLKGLKDVENENMIYEIIVEARRRRNKIIFLVNQGDKIVDNYMNNTKNITISL